MLVLVAAALALLPDLADACAVCTTGRDDETRTAFIWTTVFMSLTPLMLVGAGVFWLRRRLREQEAEQAQADGPRARAELPRPASAPSR